MVLKVLEFEGFLDKNLFNFLLNGPRNPEYSQEAPKELKSSWLNTRIWGDLKSLAELKPFTLNNLVGNVKQNISDWNAYYELEKFEYDKIPNNE